jgi:hypothetical protein
MATPPDLTTELAAVNTILAGAGETPIDSLEANQSSLAQKAVNALYEASRTLQVIGWYWNKEEDYPLAVDASGFINLPANTLKVHEARHSGGDDLVQRGQRLYNRTDHTYTFSDVDSAEVDITIYLSWDELPEFAKHPIFYLAQRRFQLRELTSTAIDQACKDDFDAALSSLHHAEDEQGPANIFNDTLDGLGLNGGARRRRGY